MSSPAQPDEAQRQQQLLAVLRGDAPPETVSVWLRDAAARARRGLQAYAANAGALAERALTAAYPTIAELVGAASALRMSDFHRRSERPRALVGS